MPPKQLVFPPITVFIFMVAALSFGLHGAAAKKNIHEYTFGLEQSLGDLTQYPQSGFAYTVKPYATWHLYKSGVYLSLAVGIPLAPADQPTQLEQVLEYAPAAPTSTWQWFAGHHLTLDLGRQTTWGAFLHAGVGLGLFSLQTEIPYLSQSIFGFSTLSLAPGLTLETGPWTFAFKLKGILRPTGPGEILGLEPLISVDFTY